MTARCRDSVTLPRLAVLFLLVLLLPAAGGACRRRAGDPRAAGQPLGQSSRRSRSARRRAPPRPRHLRPEVSRRSTPSSPPTASSSQKIKKVAGALRHRPHPHDRRHRRRAHLQRRCRWTRCRATTSRRWPISAPSMRFAYDGEDRPRFRQAAAIRRMRRGERRLRPVDLPRGRLEERLPGQDRRRQGLSRRPLPARLLPAPVRRPDLRPRPAQPADRAHRLRHRRGQERPAARSTSTTRTRSIAPSWTRTCRSTTWPPIIAHDIDTYRKYRRLRHLAEPGHHRDALQPRRRRRPRPSAGRGERASARRRARTSSTRKRTTTAGWSTPASTQLRKLL